MELLLKKYVFIKNPIKFLFIQTKNNYVRFYFD